jgi:hypothetical protein
MVIVQLSDVLQYVWGKLFGRHKIAPVISPGKTWEGLIGGIVHPGSRWRARSHRFHLLRRTDFFHLTRYFFT